MKQRAFSRFRLPAALLATGLAVGFLGCGDSNLPANTAPQLAFPRWEGRAAALFDDNIDPAAVGLSMEGVAPRADPLLRERAQTAELVARVRVQTVTVDSVGEQVTYHLGIQVGTPTLGAAKLLEKTLELEIGATSAAFPIAKAFDSRLRGSTFIGFIHRFATEGGEPKLHFHLSADTPAVADAVKDAVVLQEFSGP